MRRSSILLLLATATLPAMVSAAGPDERAERREAQRAERAEARAERAERVERAEARVERRSDRGDAGVRVERPEPRQIGVEQRGPRLDRNVPIEERQAAARERMLDRRGPDSVRLPGERPSAAERMGQRRGEIDSVRDWRREQRTDRPDRDGLRGPGSRRIEVRPPRGARPDVPAPRPAKVSSSLSAKPWHSSWRHDSRYDWSRWRARNRWLFNLGFYFDPFGWSYQRYPIGWRLWPSYYGSSYWLSDPYMYRLPPAYGPYRWVRYWDDALLVNIYSGQVVDVVYDFFW